LAEDYFITKEEGTVEGLTVQTYKLYKWGMFNSMNVIILIINLTWRKEINILIYLKYIIL
jgi:hypothetical protein